MMRCSIVHRAYGLAILAGLWAPVVAGADCQQKAARLVSLQGALEVQEGGPEEWRAVTPEQAFCAGDKIRTRPHSRATLELNDKTYISLNQQTTVVFSGAKAKSPSWLDLLKGILYVRSRTPSSLDVRTRYINAAIKGTEFMVSAGEDEGQVAVFEGTVESSNSRGSVTITDGQAAVARAGEAPVRKLLVSPRDAVQWALYYPPLVDLQSVQARSADPGVKRAAGLYLQGDSLGALAALDAAGNPDPLFRASLLVGLGRVEEAQPFLDGIGDGDPRFGEALALRSVVALARGDKAKALDLAQQAAARQPEAPAAWTALSYARQADFRLEEALEAAGQAARLDPGNALARAREAELLASLGRRRDAKRAAFAATQLNPNLSRAWSVQGYAQLTEMDYREAAESFRKAIALDNSDPLARFGLGLAKIRAGDLEEGTADLELAANLDPDDALTRSYLGKAYYEQKNSKVAATEYETAKQLDPKDPTPWFYGAIKKQTENRPVEALEDLQKAIELNDNRAIYRSRQMLDDDLAARSSAVGRIYNDLGFGQRALFEGWRSVNADAGNYSAHRFLADTYANLERHQVARVSELLQSQLLQPINVTPVQPHLAETNLLTFYGLGPAAMSFNEFNPLFERNRLALQVSGLVGSRGTGADEVTQSGVWRNVSYSLGQFRYATDGFRKNGAVQQDVYNAFVQAALTPELSVQFEARNRNISFSEVSRNLYSDMLMPGDTQREANTLRFGLHYAPTQDSDFIGSAIYVNNRSLNFTRSKEEGYVAEGQYQQRWANIKSIAGVGHVDIHANLPEFLVKYPSTYLNGYLYNYVKFPQAFTWTLGLSVDSMDNSNLGEANRHHTQINPKLGLIWDVLPDTTLRLAWFRTLKRALVTEQTIEPTQVAGFNQLFDDLNGSDVTRYGIALDHRFTKVLYVGLEASARDLSIPVNPLPRWRSNEQLYRAYFNWAPLSSLALSLSYDWSIYHENITSEHSVNFTPDTRTHRLPFRINYFHPNGMIASLGVTYFNQSADRTGYPDPKTATSQFALLDLGLGYRLPRRLGIVRFEVRNLLDQSFEMQGLFLRTPKIESDAMLPWPERVFIGQVTLAF